MNGQLEEAFPGLNSSYLNYHCPTYNVYHLMKKYQMHQKRQKKEILLKIKPLGKEDTKMMYMLGLSERVFKIATINILWDMVKVGWHTKRCT